MIGKKVRIKEGQWVAVPLRDGGFAVGIVARGNNQAVCLGYFFAPRYEQVPGDEATWGINPKEAILIGKFGNLGIKNGTWRLIHSTRPFSREEWPIPKFGMEIPFSQGKGYLREYEYDDFGHWNLLDEMVVDVDEIKGLPKDSMMGGGSVEIKLTKLLVS